MTDQTALPPCPDSPNCVSTEARDPSHRIRPIQLTGPAEAMTRRLVAVLEEMGGRVADGPGDGRIHAEFKSRLFGFVDDVDLVVDAEARVIRFRSASRTGYWDLGVNRRRMETVRRKLGGR
jgi:uncharacterized protein (DUF1499 family)